MADVIIGRLDAIGLAKETTAGTVEAAEVWIPKKTGWINPSFEEAIDDSGWGVIDEVYDSQTTKNMSEIPLGWIVRDDFIWYLLLGAMGTHKVLTMVLPTSITGTPARGWACYQGTNLWSATWTGVLKKILIQNSITYYYLETVTWSFTSWTDVKESLSDVWTLVWADSATYTGVKAHLFERLNSNSHPTFSMYGDNDVSSVYSTYCMIDQFSIKSAVWQYIEFDASMKGKKMVSTSAQSPSYIEWNPFLAKDTLVYFANTEADLNAATNVCMQTFNLNINKNLIDIQCLGSDDIAEIHNQQFTIDWDMEAIYSSTDLLDYVVDSEKKACRIEMIDTSATALVTWIYPSIYFDMSKIWFKEWSKSDDLNGIITQSMGYTGQYKSNDLMTIEILLLNSTASY